MFRQKKSRCSPKDHTDHHYLSASFDDSCFTFDFCLSSAWYSLIAPSMDFLPFSWPFSEIIKALNLAFILSIYALICPNFSQESAKKQVRHITDIILLLRLVILCRKIKHTYYKNTWLQKCKEPHGTDFVQIKISHIKEIIEIENNIGYTMGEKQSETNRFVIHYSKKRTHAVPLRRNEWI